MRSTILALLPVAVLLWLLPYIGVGDYVLHVAHTLFLYSALALSWDILLRSGQISFGIAGFVGIGGYTAVLSLLDGKVPDLIGIPLGGIAAAGIAYVIGLMVLQLRGMYFAIVTLALAEIFRVATRNLPSITGGPEGLVLPSAIFQGRADMVYWLTLVILVLSVAISEVFQRSRAFYAITTIRNDEVVASSTGIDVFKYLVITFAISSGIQGMVGGAYAQIYGFVSPEGSFSLNFTLLPMAMALFGGIHTTWGPVGGAMVLGLASEILKLQLPYGHLLIYGVIIVVAVLFFPRGVVSLVPRAVKRSKADRR